MCLNRICIATEMVRLTAGCPNCYARRTSSEMEKGSYSHERRVEMGIDSFPTGRSMFLLANVDAHQGVLRGQLEGPLYVVPAEQYLNSAVTKVCLVSRDHCSSLATQIRSPTDCATAVSSNGSQKP